MREVRIEHNVSEAELVDTLEKSVKAISDETTRYKPFPENTMVELEADGVKYFKDTVNSLFDDIAEVILDESTDQEG